MTGRAERTLAIIKPDAVAKAVTGQIITRIERAGFTVHRHRMIDYLPYPHILYVSTRRPR